MSIGFTIPGKVLSLFFNRNSKLIPYEQQFIAIYKNGNGCVKRHIKVETTKSDYVVLELIAFEKANLGHYVEILPEIHVKEIQIRETLLPGVKYGKNPDLRINGEYVEVKQPVVPYSKKAISDNINKASKQADHVLIDLILEIDLFYLEFVALRKFSDHAHLKTIEFRIAGKYLKIVRK